ncbi:hypothetical protein ABW20_dc0105836 [Dactylellina cionopaga]|nr:hypothetical protein ABW20_dc0105836 [Dactylellina cionopaga]
MGSDNEACPPTKNSSTLAGGPLSLRAGTTLLTLRQRGAASNCRLGIYIQTVGIEAIRQCSACVGQLGPFKTCRAAAFAGTKCGNCSFEKRNCQNGQFVDLRVESTKRARGVYKGGKPPMKEVIGEEEEEEVDEEEEEEDRMFAVERYYRDLALGKIANTPKKDYKKDPRGPPGGSGGGIRA